MISLREGDGQRAAALTIPLLTECGAEGRGVLGVDAGRRVAVEDLRLGRHDRVLPVAGPDGDRLSAGKVVSGEHTVVGEHDLRARRLGETRRAHEGVPVARRGADADYVGDRPG